MDFQEVKRPLKTKSVKRPIKAGKRPINEWKRPIKAKVLVGVSVACLMGCFRAPPPWRKTAPLKRPIKRSMSCMKFTQLGYVIDSCYVLCKLEAHFHNLKENSIVNAGWSENSSRLWLFHGLFGGHGGKQGETSRNLLPERQNCPEPWVGTAPPYPHLRFIGFQWKTILQPSWAILC